MCYEPIDNPPETKDLHVNFFHIFSTCSQYTRMYSCKVSGIHGNGVAIICTSLPLYLIRNNSSFLRDIKLPSIHHIEFLMTRLSSASTRDAQLLSAAVTLGDSLLATFCFSPFFVAYTHTTWSVGQDKSRGKRRALTSAFVVNYMHCENFRSLVYFVCIRTEFL